MNKLTFLEIMKQLIILYKQNQLTAATYQKVVENTSTHSISNDFISYKETEFICFIFKELPYYHILILVTNLCAELKKIANENPEVDKKFIIPLIIAYFSDLFLNINGRVSTEINVHIYKLLLQYYQNGTLNPERVIANLKENCCNPNTLTGFSIASGIEFEQTTLLGFEKKTGELRESIDRNNYNKRTSVEYSVKKIITRYFDENSFEQFLLSLHDCFKIYREENPADCDLLKDELLMHLTSLYKDAQKSWEKQRNKPKDDGYQYTISLFTN